MLKENSCVERVGNNLDDLDVDRTLDCPMISSEPLGKLHLKKIQINIINFEKNCATLKIKFAKNCATLKINFEKNCTIPKINFAP